MNTLHQPRRITEAEYQFIVRLVYDKSRISLGNEKRELVSARLGKRLRHHNLSSYEDYIRLLQAPGSGDELTQLIDAISTNHTFFFRESKHFEFLEQQIVPGHVKSAARGSTFRVWSAASSTGEEPYSIAISLSEAFARAGGAHAWSLDASDISTRVLAKAREGIYAADRVEGVPPELMRRHFLQGRGDTEGSFQVRPELRQRVRFHHVNLFQPAYPFRDPFDLIFCRNVMIYFDRPTQEQLVERLFGLLVPGGHLFVGHSESLTGIRHRFRMVKPAIYRKDPA